MGIDETNRKLDNLGNTAEMLGKELRGWRKLREPHEGCSTPMDSKLYTIATLGQRTCSELLNLHSKRALCILNGNSRRVHDLDRAIAKLMQQKTVLQEQYLDVYLGYIESRFLETPAEERHTQQTVALLFSRSSSFCFVATAQYRKEERA